MIPNLKLYSNIMEKNYFTLWIKEAQKVTGYQHQE